FYEGTKNMKAGELGGPVRTKFGYHIVKMLEVDEIPKKSYEEMRDEVERSYIDILIGVRTDKWMDNLLEDCKQELVPAMLWPPSKVPEAGETDPIVWKVNGATVRRSAVWMELLRSDGPDALTRLINREMALGPLKRLGPERMEWYGRPSNLRSYEAPPIAPIEVSKEEIDLKLNEEIVGLDRQNEERKKKKPDAAPLTFEDYLFQRYGQSVSDYRRSLEAGITLSKAVLKKVKLDDATLQCEFALTKEKYW